MQQEYDIELEFDVKESCYMLEFGRVQGRSSLYEGAWSIAISGFVASTDAPFLTSNQALVFESDLCQNSCGLNYNLATLLSKEVIQNGGMIIRHKAFKEISYASDPLEIRVRGIHEGKSKKVTNLEKTYLLLTLKQI